MKEQLYICDHAKECEILKNQDYYASNPHKKSWGCSAPKSNQCPYKDAKCTPYEEKEDKPMFKVGDRVRVVKNPDGNHSLIGKLGTLDKIDKSILPYGVLIDGRIYRDWFYIDDLELIQEGKMQYELLKACSMVDMISQHPCRNDFQKACQKWTGMGIGLNEQISKEKEEEVYYKLGDRFMLLDELHQIIPFGGLEKKVYMANLSGGLSSFRPSRVICPKDRDRITVSELKDMVGSCFRDFTKIEEA